MGAAIGIGIGNGRGFVKGRWEWGVEKVSDGNDANGGTLMVGDPGLGDLDEVRNLREYIGGIVSEVFRVRNDGKFWGVRMDEFRAGSVLLKWDTWPPLTLKSCSPPPPLLTELG